MVHFEWKKAGKPSDTSCYTHRIRREARKALSREVCFTLFQQRQDLLGSVMNACEQGTKRFHRLVREQRARPSTATETLKYDGNTLVGSEEIAASFSSHFKGLATPAPNASFDREYFRQVQYDALVIEDLCNRQSLSSFKPVTANEISSIIPSVLNGKSAGNSWLICGVCQAFCWIRVSHHALYLWEDAREGSKGKNRKSTD